MTVGLPVTAPGDVDIKIHKDPDDYLRPVLRRALPFLKTISWSSIIDIYLCLIVLYIFTYHIPVRIATT